MFQSILHNIVWKYRNLTGYIRVFTSIADIQTYRQCASGRLTGEVSLAIRQLSGNKVYCRCGSTDPVVLWDTFYWKYHVPPVKLQDIRTILDLGANVGYTAAHWAALYPNARVVAVELDRDNAEMARRNVAHSLPKSSIIEAAVWIQDGIIGYNGEHSWGFSVAEDGPNQTRAVTIPTLLKEADLDTVDLLKMDIEGAEENIFSADTAWLSQVKNLIIEWHEPVNEQWLIEKLKSCGFICKKLKRRGKIIWASKK